MAVTATGVVYVHTVPRALSPHLEWVLARALGRPLHLAWKPCALLPTHVTSRADWVGPPGAAAAVVSAVRPWARLRMEMTEDPSHGRPGERFALTPELGIFRAGMDEIGEVVVGESRLRVAMAAPDVAVAVDALLGGPWDRELEPYRSERDIAVVATAMRVGGQSRA